MHPPSLLTILPTGRDTQLVGLVVIPQATGCSKSLGLYSAGPPPRPTPSCHARCHGALQPSVSLQISPTSELGALSKDKWPY